MPPAWWRPASATSQTIATANAASHDLCRLLQRFLEGYS
jgi:hypothetical protein